MGTRRKITKRATAFGTIIAVSMLTFAGGASAVSTATKKYPDCTSLLKVYKSGVASTKKAKGKTKATLNAAVYKANKALDADGNGIACDAGDLKGSSQGSAGKKFVAKTYSGDGDETIDLGLPAGAVAVAKIDFAGEDGVTISTYDSDENFIDTPVTSYAAYSGTVLLSRGGDADNAMDVATLEVVGEGRWTIKVMPAATIAAFTKSAKGDGDAVYRYSGDDTDLAVTCQDGGSLTVLTYDKNGILVETTLDEFGEIDDVYPMTAGAYVVVRASGPWTMAVD